MKEKEQTYEYTVEVIDVLITFLRIATKRCFNSKLLLHQSWQRGYSGSSFLTTPLVKLWSTVLQSDP